MPRGLSRPQNHRGLVDDDLGGGGSAAGVNPDVGNADMILDLDMQAPGVVVDVFNQITKIPDQSIYGNDADQTETFGGTPLWPSLSTSGINGFPAVTVGNAETKGIGKNNIAAGKWLSSNANWSAIIVCKGTSGQGPLPFIPGFDGIVFPRISFGAYTAAGVQYAIPSFTGGFTAVPFTDGLVDYTDLPIILAFNCLANVCTVTVNGFLRPIAVFTGSDAIAFRSYVLGIAGGGGGETDVGEVRFYKTGLSDPALAARVGYLGAKWRIALVPAVGENDTYLVSQEIDFAAISANNVLFPVGQLTAGKKFIALNARFVIDQLDGTITTGPTLNCGNDVAKINVLASSAAQMPAASLNTAFASGLPALLSAGGGINNLNRQLIDPTVSAFKVDVTVAAVKNTATVLKGRVFVFGIAV